MEVIHQFGLNEKQTVLLFSMQRYIVTKDIEMEEKTTAKKRKQDWLNLWEQGINDVLKKLKEPTDFIEEKDLFEESKNVVADCNNYKMPLYLILLELSLFEPYFPIGELKWKFYERVKYPSNPDDPTLKNLAFMLEIDEEFIGRYKRSFKKSARSLSGTFKKILVGAGAGTLLLAITAGFAAPIIGAWVAPAGLFGGAAMNAGLAALGGGAVAAGGLGISGGMAVIVGGGSIFGAMSGSALGAILSSSSDYALLEGAKLEVVMKEIILSSQQDTRFAQELLEAQRKSIVELEEELTELKFNEEENREKIKTLSKSIDLLRDVLNKSKSNFQNYLDGVEVSEKKTNN